MAINDAFGETATGKSTGRWKIAPEAADDLIRKEMQEQADLLELSTRLGANHTVLDLTKY